MGMAIGESGISPCPEDPKGGRANPSGLLACLGFNFGT